MSGPGVSDNPYDPNTQDYDAHPKAMAEVLRIALDSWVRANLFVALPGQVVRVRDNSTVDVQPLIKEKFIVQGSVALPILQSIPVEHLRGTNWWVKAPIAVGDTGKINFYDRSLDEWLTKGGLVDPQDLRMHHISDATFTPGLYPQSNILPGAATDMVLHNGSAEIYMQQTGKFKVLNVKTNQELFTNLTNLVNTLSTASTVLGGPFIPSVVAQLTTILQNLQGMTGV